jgi:hypothetical protein
MVNKGNKEKPLKGEALREKVRELTGLSKEQKARACGYYTTTKSGTERVNLMQFLNSLMEAEGIKLDGGEEGEKRVGRKATNKVMVQSNGNLLIGATYTRQLNLKGGDEFEITLGRKHIQLKQINDSTEDPDEEE